MKRRIILILILVLLLSGCDQNGNQNDPVIPGQQGDIEAFVDLSQEMEETNRVRLELSGEAAPLADYAQTIMTLRDEGAAFLSYGLIWPAEYSFCYALSCTSSLRYAADLLLEARGEAVETEHYLGWDLIGNISLVCPCPFQLEALVCSQTGDTARAEACLDMAAMNPQQVYGAEGFAILPNMSTAGLKEIKAKLEAFEDHLLSLWPAEPLAAERSGYEFSAEYHQTCAAVALEAGNNWLALDYYEKALQTNPFLPDSYVICAMQAIKLESPETTLAYLRGGLALDETHPGLNALAAAFWLSAGDETLYKEHLAAARASDRLTDELAAFCDSLEGGIS